jgi:hypothetical protein
MHSSSPWNGTIRSTSYLDRGTAGVRKCEPSIVARTPGPSRTMFTRCPMFSSRKYCAYRPGRSTLDRLHAALHAEAIEVGFATLEEERLVLRRSIEAPPAGAEPS